MKWETAPLKRGDAIRTKISFYHHFGIFVDDETVIQFGLPDNTGTDPSDIKVLITDIDNFAEGRAVERCVFDRAERKQLRPTDEAVSLAVSRVGETGYDFFMNNCADLVNDCIFKDGSDIDIMEIRNKFNRK